AETAPPEPGQWGQQCLDQKGRHVWDGELSPKLEQDDCEVRWAGQPGAGDVSGAAHRLGGLEQLLHTQGRPHFDSRMPDLPGRTSTAPWGTSGPALPNQCAAPAGTRTVSPGLARMVRRPRRKRIRPTTTVNLSSWRGWKCRAGTWPPAGRNRSKASNRPPFCTPLSRMTIRSPLIGLSNTRPSTPSLFGIVN